MPSWCSRFDTHLLIAPLRLLLPLRLLPLLLPLDSSQIMSWRHLSLSYVEFPFLPYPSPSPSRRLLAACHHCLVPPGDPKEKGACSPSGRLIRYALTCSRCTHPLCSLVSLLPFLSCLFSQSFFEGQSAPWDSAKKDENRMKNRYGNIIACACKAALGSTHGGLLCVCLCVSVSVCVCVCVCVCVSVCFIGQA